MFATLDVLNPVMTERLLSASVQGGVAIAVVWLVCRLVPRLPPGLQATLWWLAALKLVLGLLPVPSLDVPVLPPDTFAALAPAAAPAADALLPLRAASSTTATIAPIATAWRGALVAIWLLVLTAQGVRLLVEWRRLRGIVRRAVPPEAAEAVTAGHLASAIGLGRVPELRVSPELAVPLVFGTLRPVVLLPSPAGANLEPEERRMALCHELVHVRRHDLPLGWLPALSARLFFFHPLAHLVVREYLTAREAACDAAVVRALDVSPAVYGRLLVRFGTSASRHAMAASGGASSMSSLRRRLKMLQYPTLQRVPRPVLPGLAIVVFLSMVPFELGARTSAATPPALQTAPVPSLTPEPPQAPQPAPVPPLAPEPPQAPADAQTRPAPPATPAPQAAPTAPRAPAPPAARPAPPQAPAESADARFRYRELVRAYSQAREDFAASDPARYQELARAYREALDQDAPESQRTQAQQTLEQREELEQTKRALENTETRLATQQRQLEQVQRTLVDQQMQLQQVLERLRALSQSPPN